MIQTPLVLLSRPFALPAPPPPGLGRRSPVPAPAGCRAVHPTAAHHRRTTHLSPHFFLPGFRSSPRLNPFTAGFPSHLCSALPHPPPPPFRELQPGLSARAPINDSPASRSPSKFKRTLAQPADRGPHRHHRLPPPARHCAARARDSVLSRPLPASRWYIIKLR